MFTSITQDGYQIIIPTSFHGYSIVDYLGFGSTSIVVLVYKDLKQYSAKIISKKDLKNRKLSKSIEQEIKILKELDHPNIIQIVETFDIQTANDEFYVIIMEYCSNGDLLTYVTNHGFKNDHQQKKIIYDFLQGIKYLHNKGISHGDIKSDNILLDENFNAKLCDFGFCRTNQYEGEGTKKGTLYYAAPELFNKGVYDTQKADIWSIGITLYSIVELQYPFHDGKKDFIINQITNGLLLIDPNLDQNIRKIIVKCTQMRASCRPSIEEILNSAYFNEITKRHRVGALSIIKNKYYTSPKNNNESITKTESQPKNSEWKAKCFF